MITLLRNNLPDSMQGALFQFTRQLIGCCYRLAQSSHVWHQFSWAENISQLILKHWFSSFTSTQRSLFIKQKDLSDLEMNKIGFSQLF